MSSLLLHMHILQKSKEGEAGIIQPLRL